MDTLVPEAITDKAADIKAEYAEAADDERPLLGYAATASVYVASIAAFASWFRRSGRKLPERVSAADLALLGVATHRLSRTLAKDPITSPLRAPFTRFRGTSGPSELKEEVKEGPGKSVGELLTCPFCLGQWVGTGFVGGLLVAPRATRALASVFAVVAASDTLQFVYGRVMKSAG